MSSLVAREAVMAWAPSVIVIVDKQSFDELMASADDPRRHKLIHHVIDEMPEPSRTRHSGRLRFGDIEWRNSLVRIPPGSISAV
jgi:hypothetical protein